MNSKEKFERIISYLEDLPEERFDFSKVGCGTVGCVLGHLPSVFQDTDIVVSKGKSNQLNYPEFLVGESDWSNDIASFLDIDEDELNVLTEPNGISIHLQYDIDVSDDDLYYFLEKYDECHGELKGDSSLKEVLHFWKEFYNYKFK